MRLLSVIIIGLRITILPFVAAHAQDWRGTAYSEALCGASSCETGLGSLAQNPAGTAYAPLGVALGYYNKFGLKELSQRTALISAPLGRGAASAGYSYYGFMLYNQTQAHMGYAMELGSHFSAGINIGYHHMHIDDSPQSYHAMSGDLGIRYNIGSHWSVGTWIRNITNSQFTESDTIIPMGIQTGVRRYFGGGHSAGIDVEKNNLSDQIILRGGVVLRLHENISLMCGISTLPITIGMGMEFVIQRFRLQFAARRSEHLGWIPSATLIWSRQRDDYAKKSENI